MRSPVLTKCIMLSADGCGRQCPVLAKRIMFPTFLRMYSYRFAAFPGMRSPKKCGAAPFRASQTRRFAFSNSYLHGYGPDIAGCLLQHHLRLLSIPKITTSTTPVNYPAKSNSRTIILVQLDTNFGVLFCLIWVKCERENAILQEKHYCCQ